MAWTLASLPGSILDQILAFNVSSGALNLWLCGDVKLQHKLSTHLTTLRLVDERLYSTSRFPSFATNLRVLRELVIDRDDNHLLYHQETFKIVKRLSSTLRTLKLKFNDSFEVLDVQTDLASANTPESDERLSIDTDWTIGSAFPLLETLEIHGAHGWTQRNFDRLPSSLTSLWLESPPLDPDFNKSLPRQLLHLGTDRAPQTSPWSHLPPSLLSITWRSINSTDSTDWFGDLPRSLTAMNGQVLDVQVHTIKDLPSGLTALRDLEIDNFEDLPQVNFGSSFPHLTALTLDIFGSAPPLKIQMLPRTLTELETDIDFASIVDNAQWPSGLTRLTCSNTPNLTKLPPWLVHFFGPYSKLSWVKATSACHLPAGLKSFKCGFSDSLLDAHFPPTLTSLWLMVANEDWLTVDLDFVDVRLTLWQPYQRHQLNAEMITGDFVRQPFDMSANRHGQFLLKSKVLRCAPFEHLPSTLTYLSVPNIPASKLKFLPKRLLTLKLKQLFEDYDFDPSSTEELEAMQERFEIGRQEGIEEIVDYRQLKHANVLGLLPRTLTMLSTCVDGLPEDLDWRLLPRNLIDLSLDRFIPLPPKIFGEMRLKRLAYFSISAGIVTDDHIKALPRSLTILEFFGTAQCHLTYKAPLYLPASCFGVQGFSLFRECLGALNDRRLIAAIADPSNFHKWLSFEDEPEFSLRIANEMLMRNGSDLIKGAGRGPKRVGWPETED